MEAVKIKRAIVKVDSILEHRVMMLFNEKSKLQELYLAMLKMSDHGYIIDKVSAGKELCEHFKITKNALHMLISRLKKEGYVKDDDGEWKMLGFNREYYTELIIVQK